MAVKRKKGKAENEKSKTTKKKVSNKKKDKQTGIHRSKKKASNKSNKRSIKTTKYSSKGIKKTKVKSKKQKTKTRHLRADEGPLNTRSRVTKSKTSSNKSKTKSIPLKHTTIRKEILSAPENITHSNLNKGDLKYADDVITKSFVNAISKHSPFELQDVFIFKHGVSFSIFSPDKPWNKSTEKFILSKLKGTDAKVTIVKLSKNGRSINISFNNNEQQLLIGDVKDSIEDKIKSLNDIKHHLDINYGDVYWDTFFETEDSLYE